MTIDLVDDEFLGARPLALVAEDNHHLRETTVKMLALKGLSPIGVSSVQQAQTALAHTPRIDVALLDINLNEEDEPRDKGGIAIARLLRSSNYRTRIIGYSSSFTENELRQDEKELFEYSIAKGTGSSIDHEQLWSRCADLARESFNDRRAEAAEQSSQMRRMYEDEYPQMQVLRRFRVDDFTDDEELTAEGALGLAGWKIRLVRAEIRAGHFTRPFVIWRQEATEDASSWVNLEVYAWPELYSSGTDDEDAMAGLLHFMSMTLKDVEGIEGPTVRDTSLAAFLKSIVD